jgi:hypothetical protein
MKGLVYNVNPHDPLDPETDAQTAARWRRWREREEAIEAAAARRADIDVRLAKCDLSGGCPFGLDRER